MLDNDSNTCILPGGVVKLPGENPLEEPVSSRHLETKADVFLFGDRTLFLLPIFNDRAPIWLEPLYACVYCCSLFQFMCSSISLFSWKLLLHLALSIFLPPLLTTSAPWNLREGFHKGFPIETWVLQIFTLPHIATRLRVIYIFHHKRLHCCVLFETLISLCTCQQKSFCSLCCCSKIIVAGFPVA